MVRGEVYAALILLPIVLIGVLPAWLQIVIAVLAPSGVVVTLIERTRRENNRDHNRNSQLLQRIDGKVDKIDSRLDNHIDWHAHKEND